MGTGASTGREGTGVVKARVFLGGRAAELGGRVIRCGEGRTQTHGGGSGKRGNQCWRAGSRSQHARARPPPRKNCAGAKGNRILIVLGSAETAALGGSQRTIGERWVGTNVCKCTLRAYDARAPCGGVAVRFPGQNGWA